MSSFHRSRHQKDWIGRNGEMRKEHLVLLTLQEECFHLNRIKSCYDGAIQIEYLNPAEKHVFFFSAHLPSS